MDLGAIFDLGGLRPFNEAHLIPLDNRRGEDDLAGFNVNAIAVQLPNATLTNDGQPVTAADAANAVIGVWAGASRMAPSVDGGAGELVQVSRLGNPLINEVIIPIGKKDAWNSHGPADDAQYARQLPDPGAGGDREHGLPEPARRSHDRARATSCSSSARASPA